jgi:chemotaxis protein histidine kinase CheA
MDAPGPIGAPGPINEHPKSLEEVASLVPGIGAKKLQKLVDAGIDTPEAVRKAGVPGILAVRGINVEQAKMLVDLSVSGGPSEARAESIPEIWTQILADDYDRDLVRIYLDSTLRRLATARSLLEEGRKEEACKTLDDMASSAGYMGYAPLADHLHKALEGLDGGPTDRREAEGALESLQASLEKLSIRVAKKMSADGSLQDSDPDETEELEKIFKESAESHLNSVVTDLMAFLRQMSEDLLASLQHHLSCLYSAAMNIAKEPASKQSEKLRESVEDLWLNPEALDHNRASALLSDLHRLFKECGISAPALEVPTLPTANLETGRRFDEARQRGLKEREHETRGAEVGRSDPPSGESEVELVLDTGDGLPPSDISRASERGSSDTSISSSSSDVGGGSWDGGGPPGDDGGGGLPPDDESDGTKRGLIDAHTTVRVDTLKIDDLMNMVAELVVNRSSFMVLATTMRAVLNNLIDSGHISQFEARELRNVINRYEEATTDLGRVSNQLQEGVMRIRMMPVRTLFSRVPRLVRDLARREGRQVKLTLAGEDTELDKTVIEQLSDPLIHLIRNAVSHGIESRETRTEAGKPAEGRLTISAHHEGNMVILEIEDDGRGIDPNKIREAIVSSEICSGAEAARKTRRELLSYIFRSGFSTAEGVSDLSGRGVGLDVVKRNIEGLGGQVDVVSEEGRSCRFSLRIPLTMAIMQALLVRATSEVYSIPVAAVIQTVKVNKSDISTVENQDVITVRDTVTPLVRLTEVFSYNYHLETHQMDGVGENVQDASDDESLQVVVIQAENRQIGIVVDDLLGSQDIVIKSLEDELVDARGIAGAAILGDGTVTLILDISEVERIATDPDHYSSVRRGDVARRLERMLDRDMRYLPGEQIH